MDGAYSFWSDFAYRVGGGHSISRIETVIFELYNNRSVSLDGFFESALGSTCFLGCRKGHFGFLGVRKAKEVYHSNNSFVECNVPYSF
jgi:hypothetical protein